MNYAYVSVLTTESYLIGILATYKCLKRVNSKYPFYVVITDNISNATENLLNDYGINIIRKNSIEIPDSIKLKNSKSTFSHWTNTFDKLSIFELTQFDKIVYLDSDMYIRKNIDSLFMKNHMSAVQNRKYGPSATVPYEPVSALLVIEPRKGMLEIFKDILFNKLDNLDAIGDQDIIQAYFSDWKNHTDLHLDIKYNVFFTYLDYYLNFCDYKLDDICVFHFILSKKPWDFSLNNIDDYIKFLNDRIDFLYNKCKSQEFLDCINAGNDGKKIIAKEYFELLDSIRNDERIDL